MAASKKGNRIFFLNYVGNKEVPTNGIGHYEIGHG